MKVSSIAPAAVFPDTDAGRGFAQMFYPTSSSLRDAGVEFCPRYVADGARRSCAGRSPRPDGYERDPLRKGGVAFGAEFNWCTRCPAGFMQEKMLGADIEHGAHF